MSAAQALATPVRRCNASGAWLPRFFLQDFSLVEQPETGRPWWVPQSLALPDHWQPDDSPEASDSAEQSGGVLASDGGETEGGRGAEAGAAGEAGSLTNHGAEPAEQSVGPSLSKGAGTEPGREAEAGAVGKTAMSAGARSGNAYVLRRYDMMQDLKHRDKRNHYFSKVKAFSRLLAPAGKPRRRRPAVWRADMADFALELLRRRVVGRLCELSDWSTRKRRRYITRCAGWDDVRGQPSGVLRMGAVLWFDDGDSGGGRPPGRFATLDFDGPTARHSVAVHNMHLLLAPEDIRTLRRRAAVLDAGHLFMLTGKRSTSVQMTLWQLQCYLDYPDDGA